MPESTIIRILSVLVVMGVVGFVSFPLMFSRLKKKGVEETAARKQAMLRAKTHSVVAGFLYMVFMVSAVSLFL